MLHPCCRIVAPFVGFLNVFGGIDFGEGPFLARSGPRRPDIGTLCLRLNSQGGGLL
jgi:hypothetical protein